MTLPFARIYWNEDFSVGVSSIDEQHKIILNMLNDVIETVQTGSHKQQLVLVILKLVNYTVRHFNYEESLLEKAGYPIIEAHKKLHEDLSNQMQTFVDRLEKEGVEIATDLLIMLTEWWTDHILEKDMGYSKLLVEKAFE